MKAESVSDEEDAKILAEERTKYDMKKEMEEEDGGNRKAKALKAEIEKDISGMLTTYERNTGLIVDEIGFIRQPVYDNMGKETDFRYVVELRVKL